MTLECDIKNRMSAVADRISWNEISSAGKLQHVISTMSQSSVQKWNIITWCSDNNNNKKKSDNLCTA